MRAKRRLEVKQPEHDQTKVKQTKSNCFKRRRCEEEHNETKEQKENKESKLVQLIGDLRKELRAREESASHFTSISEVKIAACAWSKESEALKALEDDIGQFCRGAAYTGPHVKPEAIRSALGWRPSPPTLPYMVNDEVYFLVLAGPLSRIEKVTLTKTHSDSVEFLQSGGLLRRVPYHLISAIEPAK